MPELRDRAPVFENRAEAGRALVGLLEGFRASAAVVLAIPAGGVPVGAEIAAQLGLSLDVAPVSKMLFPWTTESGFGAV
ncbi:MAG: phosphoribosyltransferase, partial [Burkholderiales bacterium]